MRQQIAAKTFSKYGIDWSIYKQRMRCEDTVTDTVQGQNTHTSWDGKSATQDTPTTGDITRIKLYEMCDKQHIYT